MHTILYRLHTQEYYNPSEWDEPLQQDYFFRVDTDITPMDKVLDVLKETLLKQYGRKHFGMPEEEDKDLVSAENLAEWDSEGFYFGRDLDNIDHDLLWKHGIQPVYFHTTVNADWDDGQPLW